MKLYLVYESLVEFSINKDSQFVLNRGCDEIFLKNSGKEVQTLVAYNWDVLFKIVPPRMIEIDIYSYTFSIFLPHSHYTSLRQAGSVYEMVLYTLSQYSPSAKFWYKVL